MGWQVGERVQVICRRTQRREAIGEVLHVHNGAATVCWTLPGSIGLPCRETFGPRGGGNEDYTIRPYTEPDARADAEKAQREAGTLALRGMLARIDVIAGRLSDKEQRALAAALRVFDPGVDDADVQAAEQWRRMVG